MQIVIFVLLLCQLLIAHAHFGVKWSESSRLEKIRISPGQFEIKMGAMLRVEVCMPDYTDGRIFEAAANKLITQLRPDYETIVLTALFFPHPVSVQLCTSGVYEEDPSSFNCTHFSDISFKNAQVRVKRPDSGRSNSGLDMDPIRWRNKNHTVFLPPIKTEFFFTSEVISVYTPPVRRLESEYDPSTESQPTFTTINRRLCYVHQRLLNEKLVSKNGIYFFMLTICVDKRCVIPAKKLFSKFRISSTI